MKTAELIAYVAPGKEFSLIGEPSTSAEYKEALTWYSEGEPPTWAALKKAEPEAEYSVSYDAVSTARHAAYVAPGGSDSVFMKYQRGQATEQEWLDAVTAINEANPYPAK